MNRIPPYDLLEEAARMLHFYYNDETSRTKAGTYIQLSIARSLERLADGLTLTRKP